MKMLVYTLLKLLPVGIFLQACTQEPPTPPLTLSQQLDSLFQNWNLETPGGALAVQQGDQIIYSKAFGLTDLEHETVNTTETIFETGSVGKQFTAAAILLLVLDGKIKLDDNIRTYLPELPDFHNDITIAHLLYHTSGLRDWGAVAAMSGRDRGVFVHANAHVLDILMQQKGLNFSPGTQFNYNNSNYNLLAIIVERVSGQNFAQFTTERIFKPLGMSNTRWRDDYRRIVKNRAIAYQRYGKKYLLNMPFELAHGHSGLLTTPEDLLKWVGNFKSKKVGGQAFIDLQLKRGCLNNGMELAYAGGVFIREYQDLLEISHSGYTAGYRAWLAYYPNEDVTVAFMSNDGSANPEKIGSQVAELVVKKKFINPIPKTVNLNRSTLQRYVGRYKSTRTDEMFELNIQNGGLNIIGYQTMFASSPYTFHWGASKMVFAEDLQTVFVFTGNGDSSSYVRKDPIPLSVDSLPPYLGTYRSEEAETVMRIELESNQLRIFQRPAKFYLLQPIFEDAFISPRNQLFQFQRDTIRIITGFKLSTDRAQGVWFEKEKLDTIINTLPSTK